MKQIFLSVVVLVLLNNLTPNGLWAQDKISELKKNYTVGVVPQFDSLKLRKIWQPIIKELVRRTGIKLIMKGSPTIPAFEKEFNSGVFNFAYMNPFHVLLASENQGYIPLVNDKGRTLHGILVVRKDSPIKSPKDLAGEVIAFPAPNALGASLMIRAALQEEFHIKIRPKYVQTHSSVYLNVALGEASAGGGVQKTLSQQPEEVQNSLLVLYRTQDFIPHPFTAHPRVPQSIRNQILNAILDMGKSSKGRALLSKVPIKEAGPVSVEEYYPLKKLKLQRFYQKD